MSSKCQYFIYYYKVGNVKKIKKVGGNYQFISNQNGGRPGARRLIRVRPNTNLIADFYCKKTGGRDVIPKITGGHDGGKVLAFDTSKKIKNNFSTVSVRFNSGNNRAIYVGLNIINAIKGDSFTIRGIGLRYA